MRNLYLIKSENTGKFHSEITNTLLAGTINASPITTISKAEKIANRYIDDGDTIAIIPVRRKK